MPIGKQVDPCCLPLDTVSYQELEISSTEGNTEESVYCRLTIVIIEASKSLLLHLPYNEENQPQDTYTAYHTDSDNRSS
jgi:hypothetical protein